MDYVYDFNNLERDNEIYFERFEKVTEDLFKILENYQKCISDTKSIIEIQNNIKLAIKESIIFKSVLNNSESTVRFKKKDLDDLVKLINRLYINKLLDIDFTDFITENIENSDELIYYHDKIGIVHLINTCLMEELAVNQIEFIDSEQLIIGLSNKAIYALNHPTASASSRFNGACYRDTVLRFPETYFINEFMKCNYSVLTQQLAILIMNIIKIDSENQANHIVKIILLRSHFNRIIEYINKIKKLTGPETENNIVSDASFPINKFKSLINKLLVDKYYLMAVLPKSKRQLYIESESLFTDKDYKIISLSNNKDKKI